MNRYAIVAILLVCTVRIGAAQEVPESSEFPYYVGKSVCLTCHAGDGHAPDQGGVCTLEAIPTHDTSYKLLEKPKAESIAALSGVSETPTQSRICLDCHATAADEGPRWTKDTFHVEDSVQCETCHGAGSVHVDFYQSKVSLPSSLPLQYVRLKRGNRDDCKRCHIDRPSHNEVLKKGFRVSQTDREYKTPVNLTVSPDGKRLYVACEHADSLVVIDCDSRTVAGEVAVGRRPHGVAVSDDGRRIFVSNRIGATVTVIDAASLSPVGEVGVGSEPHGLWVDPSGKRVFVTNTGNNSLSVIDTGTMTETRRLVMGDGPWDIAVDSGNRFAYVTSVRPNNARFREPRDSELTVVDVQRGVVASRSIVPRANMLQGITWVPKADVGLFVLLRTKNLIPVSRLAQGWVITNGLGVVEPGGRITQVLLDEPNNFFPDPMELAASPDGRYALVTSGGTDAVAVIDVTELKAVIAESSEHTREEVLPNYLGTSSRIVTKRIQVGSNPRGVAFSPDGRFAYVGNALDDTVSVIDASAWEVVATIPLGGPAYTTQIRWGEKLFHSADITYAHEFSCRSCHPDGHINGLTFDIEADGLGIHPVDNRTLRGIFDTPPFKWEGTNPTIHRQCGPRLAVFFTRLDPYSPAELDALVRYICTIEQPPNPYRKPEGLTLQQRRGKAIFERTTLDDGTPIPPEHQCATCHAGAYFTDRQRVAVGTTMWFDAFVGVNPKDIFNTDDYGELGTYYFIEPGMPLIMLDVPHLRNIFDSPPYLHNGAAPTLEEIWTRFNLTDRHGATVAWTRQQLNDIIAYLKSL